MKKSVFKFLVLIVFLLPSESESQQLSIVLPGAVCFNQSVNISASHSLTGSANCVWSITPSQSITSLSSSSDHVGIYFASCGMHTLTCNLYDNVTNTLIATSSQTINVLCQSAPSLTLFAATLSLCPGYTVMATVLGADSYTWLPGSQQQNTISAGPGNYTVMGTNSVGCVSQRTFSLGTSSPLSISVTQSSFTTCVVSNTPKFSKPVQLNFSGASSYVVFPYNPGVPVINNTTTVRPATSTCYTVVGSVATCSGTTTVCVNVIPQFSITVNKKTLIRCYADTVALAVTSTGTLATGPASSFTYSWSEGLNAPPISMNGYLTPTVQVFPQNNTTYTVEVFDSVGCVSSAELINVNVSACTGLMEKEYDDKFFVYPNPSSNKIYFLTTTESISTLELRNLTGTLVMQLTHLEESVGIERQLDVSGLAPGIYVLQFCGEGKGFKPTRIIKE